MIGTSRHFYRFGSFRLDVGERQLFQDDAPIALSPKAFDLLAMLVQNSGHLVEKDELLRAVWADSFVEEGNISRNIHILRKVLGDGENGTKFIETVATKGYRFVAKVAEEVEQARPSAEIGPQAYPAVDFPDTIHVSDRAENEVRRPIPASPTVNRVSPRYLLFGLGFLTAISLIAVLSFNSQPDLPFGTGETRSIAVLPPKPIDPANRSDNYENGIADSLINRLNAVEGLIARPLSATRKYTDLNQDAIAAGREQKAYYVLASNYQIADGKIRVTSQLYDVATGKVLDTFQSEQDAGNVFAAQDAIAAEFGDRMMNRFSVTMAGKPAARGTSSEDAYSHYQQAQFLLAQSRGKGIESLEKAVAADPNYAKAWAALAYAYTAGVGSGGGPGALGNEESYRRSLDAANKALALDPGVSEAYCALCMNRMYYERNAAGAEDVCKRAVDLDPKSAAAHGVYGIFLSTRGRHDEAIAAAKTAMELEPASYFPRRWHANFLYWARRYDETIVEVKRLLEVNDGDRSRHRWLMWSYENLGKYNEAFDALLGALAAYEKDEEAIERFKNVFRSSGWPGVLIELEKEDGLRFNSYRRAAMNVQIGNRDKAFELLEDAYAKRLWEVAFLQVDPAFDPVRDDPRYVGFVKRLDAK